MLFLHQHTTQTSYNRPLYTVWKATATQKHFSEGESHQSLYRVSRLILNKSFKSSHRLPVLLGGTWVKHHKKPTPKEDPRGWLFFQTTSGALFQAQHEGCRLRQLEGVLEAQNRISLAKSQCGYRLRDDLEPVLLETFRVFTMVPGFSPFSSCGCFSA